METDNYPDGLTEQLIDALLAEMLATVEPVRRPTSPFADQAVETRRERRRLNRELSELHRTHVLICGTTRQGKAAALPVSLLPVAFAEGEAA